MGAGWTAVVAIAGLAGCVEHPPLVAPSPASPLSMRLDAYRRLRPRAYDSSASCYGGCQWHDSVELSDGTWVSDPEDLLPLVDANSPTAHAVHEVERLGTERTVWGGILYGSTIGGSVMVFSAFPAGSPGLLLGGLGLAFVGSLVGGIPYYLVGREESEARISAYETFDESLRAHLHLCASGTNIVECP